MRVIIAGSRGLYPKLKTIDEIVKASGFDVTEVVSGGARGVDTAGENWASFVYAGVKAFLADWKDLSHPDAVIGYGSYGAYDKMAGHRRNKKMAEYADALIAIWDGKSSGTKNMISQMKRLGKKVFVVILDGEIFKTVDG